MSHVLSRRDIEILKSLYKAENPIYQSEIPSLLGLDSKIVSKTLSKLEKLGFITREQVVYNKRLTYLIRVNKKAILEALEEIGESPLTLREIIENATNIPCVICPYINRCYEGGFYDPLTCPRLSGYIKSILSKASFEERGP
mgnify:FL=1